MLPNYSRQTDKTGREKKKFVPVEESAPKLESNPTIDRIEELLDYSAIRLPNQNQAIVKLKYLAKLQRVWEKATHLQRQYFSVHISAVKDGNKKKIKTFLQAHMIKAAHINCCVKSMQRARKYWEDNGVFSSTKTKVGNTKTVNYFDVHVDFDVEDFVVIGDSLMYNYFDSTGVKKFTTLKEYLVYKLRQLLAKVDKKLKEKKEKIIAGKEKRYADFQAFVRECPSNKSVYINIANISIDNLEKVVSEEKFYAYEQPLLDGIFLSSGHLALRVKQDDMYKFRKYREDIVLTCIENMKNISVDKVFSLDSALGYMLTCCKNLQFENTSWKRVPESQRKVPRERYLDSLSLEHQQLLIEYTLSDPIPVSYFT